MKTVTAIAATVALFAAAPTFASTSLKFVAANDQVETQVCVAAVKDGMQGADKVGKELGLSKYETRNVICNGRAIASFSRKYKDVSAEVVSTKS
ncbi:hypothetical protein K0504_01550 [Neiella marina]|uniref:DUF3718 domain-containing protein n=1 Tax=Neiella holothuriorum TaxID=2870530 RepID=A0ABS7EBN1_9GAMM|nr:hypothetical protein [Neiella holothuriorum]MBW8189706.1 hypothetical protein [Neiella holothuriorum]